MKAGRKMSPRSIPATSSGAQTTRPPENGGRKGNGSDWWRVASGEEEIPKRTGPSRLRASKNACATKDRRTQDPPLHKPNPQG